MDSPSLELIVAAAMELPESSRPRFLRQACDGDERLREKAEALLNERLADKGGFRNAAAPDPAEPEPLRPFGAPMPATSDTQAPSPATASALREKPGAIIGRYKLLQQIGEGGFGVVFMAEQTEPVVRRVALKIIKLGMDTKHVVARFEAERQALAMMDHPAIAKVLDGGATDSGRPYFVMELVRGVPITSFCDQQKLPLRERLDLFREVCAAVQHAHQKGIIHRDLKPSNILVTVADARPLPKIIDFGIAKAMHFRLTEKTVFTEFRQLIGTPEYMSPEQAEVSGVDIDTRSDIFSLGVLLYELLTGVTPLDGTSLRSAAYGEMQRLIREYEPAKPSTRLATLQSLPTAAANRRVDAGRLPPLLRGDLDWIVMKCIDKDRARRYDSAAALSDDVRRHLAGEAVLATPPTASYRLRKFALRHRRALAMAAVIVAGLVGGLILMTVGFIKARADRDAAVAARAEAITARQRADDERDAAQRARAEAVAANDRLALQTQREQKQSDFLKQLFVMTDPGKTVETPENFDVILARSREALGESNPITDSVLASWVQTLLTFGRTDRARPAAEQLYKWTQGRSDSDPFKAWAGALYARAVCEAGDPDEGLRRLRSLMDSAEGANAVPFLDAFITIMRAQVGTPPKELAKMWPLVLKLAPEVYGPDSDRVLEIRCAYGVWLQETNRWSDAAPVLEEAVAKARSRGKLSESVLIGSLNSLTLAYMTQERNADAKQTYRELMDLLKARYGSASPVYKRNFEGYTGWLTRIGESALAESETRRLAVESAVVGRSSPHAVRFAHAAALASDRKYADAARWAGELLDDLRSAGAPSGDAQLPGQMRVERLLIAATAKAGRPEEAQRLARAQVAALERSPGPDHELTILGKAALAGAIDAGGDHAAATALLADLIRAALAIRPANYSLAANLDRSLARLTESPGDESARASLKTELSRLAAALPPSPLSDDFEADAPGAFPRMWYVPPVVDNEGQITVVAAHDAFQGKNCLQISGFRGIGKSLDATEAFRNVIQSHDAARFRGAKIRYTAAVRLDHDPDDAAACVQMWLRVDRPGYAKPALFDNMSDRPIRSASWATYQIEGVVDADAERIVLGVMVFGEGTAWIDDVRFEILEEGSFATSPAPGN